MDRKGWGRARWEGRSGLRWEEIGGKDRSGLRWEGIVGEGNVSQVNPSMFGHFLHPSTLDGNAGYGNLSYSDPVCLYLIFLVLSVLIKLLVYIIELNLVLEYGKDLNRLAYVLNILNYENITDSSRVSFISRALNLVSE